MKSLRKTSVVQGIREPRPAKRNFDHRIASRRMGNRPRIHRRRPSKLTIGKMNRVVNVERMSPTTARFKKPIHGHRGNDRRRQVDSEHEAQDELEADKIYDAIAKLSIIFSPSIAGGRSTLPTPASPASTASSTRRPSSWCCISRPRKMTVTCTLS